MRAKIVFELDGKHVIYQLEKSEIFIGRDACNDIVIERPVISRRHARIFRVGEDWRVADLSSLNGTRARRRSRKNG